MPERIPAAATIRVPLQAYLNVDHITPATGVTIAVTISKNGAAYANPSAGATNATEIGNGSYYVDLSTTDTGTVGPLFVKGTSATIDNVIAIYDVVVATNGGWTALPNAVAGATGGLAIPVVRGGTAQSGNSSSIRLDASASATNNFYRGLLVHLVSGTGAGQVRTITNYTGATKQANVDRNWVTAPDNTSVFELLAADNPTLNQNLQVTANVAVVTIRSGTAQAGSTANTIVLDSGASTTNNLYNGSLITLTGGTGAGQTRTVISYNGTAKVATVDRSWVTTPDNTTTFDIYASTTASAYSDQGVAQAGAATTITLADTASTSDDVYNGSIVTILSGTGSGQTREITDYVGSTRVATVDTAWSVNPDSTSAYAVIPTVSGTGEVPGNQDVNVISWAGESVSILPANFSSLDINATGGVGIDWGNVQNQSTGVNLSSTEVRAVSGGVSVVTLLDSELVVDYGDVSASTSNTVTYTVNKQTTPDCLVGCVVSVYYDGGDGTRIGQPRTVTGAADAGGGLLTLTVDSAWDVNPTDSTPDRITVWAFGPSSRVTGNVGGSVGSIAGVTFPSNFSSALTLPTNDQLVKTLAAVYDTATGSGGNTLTLSDGATQVINLSTGTRTTTPP